MSGLVGWIDFRRDLTTQREVFASMVSTMQARGPDASGSWCSRHAALGHRRLAVTDVAGGGQPRVIETKEGPVVAVHAGKIYDAPELRRELEALGGAFETRADVEVLLRAFLHWGDRFVERLDGMFAFAIWDGRAQRLLLGRDRLGVKPLYTFAYPGGLVFASEPKGIMANPSFEARLDLAALPILLQPRLARAGETPLVGLRELPPAHLLSYSREQEPAYERYWRLTSRPHTESFEDTARHVRALLEEIVTRELVADVPRGAMLSGGIDSTSVAALAMKALGAEHPPRALETFCVQFESDPDHFVASELRPEVDAPYAASAAAFLGTQHHTLTASAHGLHDVLPATRRARDLPGWGQFDASMYLLFSHMREHCKVALTGEAADEIFGGYPYFFKPELLARDQFPWLGDAPRLSDHLSPEVRRHVDPREDERARYAALLAEVPRLAGEDPAEARMREVFYLGLSGPLAVILDRKDRMSASQGLEVRVPFCDHRLVEYVWNVPWSMKAQGGVKGLLKAAMADLLPASTLARKKSAYPHVQSPEHDRGLVREARRIVADRRSPIAWLFDGAGLERWLAELGLDSPAAATPRTFPGGASPAYMLIHLIELSQWIEDYRVSVR